MRAAIILVFALSMSTACKNWRTENVFARSMTSEYPAGTVLENGHILVVTTKGEALELDHAKGTLEALSGMPVRAWRVPATETDGNELEELDPDEIAKVRGWQPIDHPDQTWIEVPAAQVLYTRVYATNVGRTAARTGFFGAPLALAVLAVIVIATTPAPSCGRPLRVRGRRCITPVTASTEWIEPLELAPVPDDVRDVLIEIWTEEAQAEHAAVAAFSKLSLELLAVGAPPELVARANRAALQEVHHARLCFGVASAYTGRRLGPAALPQALDGDTVDLLRIARESLLDGCMREGLAAEIARIGAGTARDPVLARVLRIQANEEAQHAALGWAIVDWCLASGGELMRTHLIAAMSEARAPRGDDLPEHGRVCRERVKQLFDEMMTSTRARLCRIQAETAKKRPAAATA
jgi:hypothetical protein